MITGTVSTDREAVLKLTMLNSQGQEHEYVTVVDTGYNGTLTLPPREITALGLRWHRHGHALLADGSDAMFGVYTGIVIWDGQPITITVDEMDAQPLVGMSLMYGYELLLPILDGSTFTLKRTLNP